MTRSTTAYKSCSRLVLATLCLAAMLVSGSSLGGEEPGPLKRLAEDMDHISKLIHNIEVKLRVGASGISQDSNVGAAPTPAQICCSGNIKLIRARFKTIEEVSDLLASCYDSRGDRGGNERIVLVRQDLKALNQGIDIFERTANSDHLKGLMAGLTRSYLNLLDSVESLPECSLPPAE